MGGLWLQIPNDIIESEYESDEWSEGIEYIEEYYDPFKGGTRSTNLIVAGSQYIQDWRACHG
jgi:hypothetical protein